MARCDRPSDDAQPVRFTTTGREALFQGSLLTQSHARGLVVVSAVETQGTLVTSTAYKFDVFGNMVDRCTSITAERMKNGFGRKEAMPAVAELRIVQMLVKRRFCH